MREGCPLLTKVIVSELTVSSAHFLSIVNNKYGGIVITKAISSLGHSSEGRLIAKNVIKCATSGALRGPFKPHVLNLVDQLCTVWPEPRVREVFRSTMSKRHSSGTVHSSTNTSTASSSLSGGHGGKGESLFGPSTITNGGKEEGKGTKGLRLLD
jgi:hypothetical protein